jgi:hypothetical protein
MSTRAIIAKTGEVEGHFSGVYHHWDGMPTSLGSTLVELLRGHFKNNLPKMLRVLTEEHGGWSTIVGKNFRLKPGYKNNHEAKNPMCYCHGDRHEKLTPFTHLHLTPDTDIEWLYAFDVEHNTMCVRDVRHNAEFLVDLAKRVSKKRWTEIECGGEAENWARCTHYAWAHKMLPRTSNLSTKTYLGLKPLDFHDVIAFVIDGVRYTATGSGGNSDYLARSTGQRYPRGTWVSSVKIGNERLDLPVAKIVGSDYAPIPGVIWIMPSKRVTNQETRVSA